MLAAIAALAGRFPVLETELRAAQDRLGERPRLLRQRLPAQARRARAIQRTK